MEQRVCKTCEVEKPLSEYPKHGAYKDGIRPHCNPCRQVYERKQHHTHKHNRPYVYEVDKSRKLQKEYGIDYQKYLEMLDNQNGKCAICGTSDTGGRKAFHVDHCHNTKKVRGLLCGNCNSGIGNLRDDINLLQRAIEYLQSTKVG